MKKEKKVWAITLIVLWWLAPSKTNAQQDSIKSFNLNEVVISASRQESTLLETPRSVSVINRERIQNATYNSVGDLLSQEAGIYLVGANQNPGANQSLFMRGSNSNQVAVMIDGVRITDPSSPNNVIDLSELSLTNIERIEIVKGAHSTIYGGSAVGGVINIITRKNIQEGLHGVVSAQAGAFGKNTSNFLQTIDLNYSHQDGFYLNASQIDQYVNGLNASVDTVKNSKVRAEADNFRKTDRSVKLGYRQGPWDAFVSYKRVDQMADIDNGAYQDKTNDKLKFVRDFYNYFIGYQLRPGWKISLVGSWSSSLRTNQNDSSRLASGKYDGSYFKGDYGGTTQTHELQTTYKKGLLSSVVGLGLYKEDMSFNTYFYSSSFGGFSSKVNYDSINKNVSTGYLFAQTTLRRDEKPFGVTIGGRISNHSIFGTVGTYEINPFFSLNKSLIYASLSSAYNAPSLYQLFDPSKSFGTITPRGNKELKPEESLSLEVGYKKSFLKDAFVTVSVFNTISNNSIEYVYFWRKNIPISSLSYSDYLGDTYLNISKQTVYGIELGGGGQIAKGISVKGNFTWLESELQFSPSNINTTKTESNQVQLFSVGSFINAFEKVNSLARRPSVTGFAAITFQLRSNLSISVDYRLASSRFDSVYDPKLGPFGALGRLGVQSYHLFDGMLNWKWSSNISVAAKLENIFDVNYAEIAGFSTRGRSMYCKVSFRW
jgi:vitamin B12 transporter